MHEAVRVDARGRRLIVLTLCLSSFAGAAASPAIGPPMLDITRQCDSIVHHNVSAMSECVVAESEARSEILQKWDRISNASAQKCVKLGRQAKRFPYVTMAKCLAAEAPLPPPTPAGDAKK